MNDVETELDGSTPIARILTRFQRRGGRKLMLRARSSSRMVSPPSRSWQTIRYKGHPAVATVNPAGKRRRESTMAYYALQAAYTPLGWSAMLKNPQHRLEAVRPVVERLGGSIVQGWFTFGDHDVLVICEMPDNMTAAALAMAIAAGGAIKSVKTTPLMTFEDGIEALKKAKEAEYTPPPSEIPYFGVSREGS